MNLSEPFIRRPVATSLIMAALALLGITAFPFLPVAPPEDAWLVAGGVGLAPFVMLAEALSAKGTAVRLYYGARRASELFFLDEFEKLGARLILATEDGSRGDRGHVTVPLERDLRDRHG